jgi:hypothetical protein
LQLLPSLFTFNFWGKQFLQLCPTNQFLSKNYKEYKELMDEIIKFCKSSQDILLFQIEILIAFLQCSLRVTHMHASLLILEFGIEFYQS